MKIQPQFNQFNADEEREYYSRFPTPKLRKWARQLRSRNNVTPYGPYDGKFSCNWCEAEWWGALTTGGGFTRGSYVCVNETCPGKNVKKS